MSDRVREGGRSKPITEAEITAAFAGLPPDKLSRDYEREITAWVIQQARPEDFTSLETALRNLAADPSLSFSHRFDAFFALANLYRRYPKVKALEDLIEAGRKIFGNYELLVSHLEIMMLNMKGDRKSCLEALEKATELLERWPHVKHPGLRHNYAETVAICVNDGYRRFDEDLLQNALRAVKEAIRDDPKYSKFCRTRGWPHFLLKDAEEGRRWYQTAIELERPEKLDYGLRLAEYRRELSVRTARLDLDQLTGELTELRTKANELQTRQVEVLGFFTGILALLLGSGWVMGRAPDYQASFGLMVSLAGLLLVVFGGFGFMLHGWEKGKRLRSILPIALGACLLLWGYLDFRSRAGQPANVKAAAGPQADARQPGTTSSPTP